MSIEKTLQTITGRGPPVTVKEGQTSEENESIHASWKDIVSLSDKAHFLMPPHSKMASVLSYRKENFGSRGPEKATNLLGMLSSWLEIGKRKLLCSVTPPRTLGKKVCIVGVHGWFPTKMLQTVLGVPKGTSTRLCSMMQEATKEFIDRQPLAYFEITPEISCIPLEGEGCIWERVEKHYSQLSTMKVGEGEGGREKDQCVFGKSLMQEADSVIFVAHSQGAPVSVLLMEKLLEEGVLQPHKRQSVALLTLAGVFHGPFPELKENLVIKYVEADAARELFDLNKQDSALSSGIRTALDRLLKSDIVLATVSSWLDQVVPLHSSSLLGMEHPNVWRSIYVDAHNYRPDFLSKFVESALTMVNAQVPGGHQLLAQLGGALAGSLYQSNAHSTLHGDYGVFATILQWMYALPRVHPKTPGSTTILSDDDFGVKALKEGQHNPYLLPWIMRGLLGDQRMIKDPLFAVDLEQLTCLHSNWKPDKRIWKELKLQLQPLSKL